MKLVCKRDIFNQDTNVIKFVKGKLYRYETRTDDTMYMHILFDENGKQEWFNNIPISNDYIYKSFYSVEEYREKKLNEIITD